MTTSRPEDPMVGRIARFADIKKNGTAIMFIDSILPDHHRLNYAVVGDTASENPDYTSMLSPAHKFQIGMFEAPPGNGPAWHTHEYVELFIPLSGRWRFYYGLDADHPESPLGEATLDPWDVISFPPRLWRGFENVSEVNAWGLGVLDPHDVFAFRDPIWPEWLVRQAAQQGLQADPSGKMVQPADFGERERRLRVQIESARSQSPR